MPAANLFVRPEPLGLDVMLVGPDINWKAKAQIANEENPSENEPKEEPRDDTEMPELVPLEN